VRALRPRLLIGIGNPSRGDDALGPACVARLEAMALADVELLCDFQLQVEHLLDLHGREEVIIVDATLAGKAAFSFQSVDCAVDVSYSTHAVSPASLLAAYRSHYGVAPPPTGLLAVRGERFELGEGLSQAACQHLDEAIDWLVGRHWRQPFLPCAEDVGVGLSTPGNPPIIAGL
jgi:hydrogenase maturation protease